jgi:hypothetical protein
MQDEENLECSKFKTSDTDFGASKLKLEWGETLNKSH